MENDRHGFGWIAELSDEKLLNALADNEAGVDRYTARRDRMVFEVHQRIERRGATSIPSETYVCEVSTPNNYDQTAFTPLKEVFGAADLATCFTPAHEVTRPVPDKWHTQKVKALANRYGQRAKEIVERARVPGAPRLTFKRRA